MYYDREHADRFLHRQAATHPEAPTQQRVVKAWECTETGGQHRNFHLKINKDGRL
jgi:hypothetical protein